MVSQDKVRNRNIMDSPQPPDATTTAEQNPQNSLNPALFDSQPSTQQYIGRKTRSMSLPLSVQEPQSQLNLRPRRNSWTTLKSLASTFVELMETHRFSTDLHPAERRFLQEVYPSCLKFQHCQILQKYGYTKYKRPSKQNLKHEHVSCPPLLRK